MTNYLTTSSASSTYSTLTNQVKTNVENTFTNGNYFNDVTFFNQAITQDYITLPSGMVNKLVYTSFLEAVEVGGYLTTLNRIKLPISGASAYANDNELGYIKSGTFSTSAIGSATNTTLSTLSLPYGVWIVTANVCFQSNGTVGTFARHTIGFNRINSTAISTSRVGFGTGNTFNTTANNTTQIQLSTTETVINTSGTPLTFCLNALINYTTTTMSINTGQCSFTAVRIG